MKRITIGLLVAAIACALALCVGCSSPQSASSAASDAASQASSASAAAQADAANLADGDYQIAVTLTGGSGKATVESPAKLMVQGGEMTAVIVWSSPNYDLMVVDGVEYTPVPRAGNSTFQIPVSALDVDLPIQAETTAMSEPHMIDYTITFDTGSIRK